MQCAEKETNKVSPFLNANRDFMNPKLQRLNAMLCPDNPTVLDEQ